MEVYAFFIVMGMLVALIFVMIGVCIGQVHASNNQKPNKSNPDNVSGTDNNRSISDSVDTNRHNSSLGDVHREKHNRYTYGRMIINKTAMKAVLGYFSLGASSYEKAVLDAISDFIGYDDEEISLGKN